MIQPQVRRVEDAPRTSHVRVREATRRRTTRARRRGVVGFVRVTAIVAAIVAPFIVYVMLMAHLTSLGDRVARASAERAALVEETARLDDTIAVLTSQERLAAIAQKLGMREAHVYASVVLPAPPEPSAAPKGIAFLGPWFAK
jgi:cell division protein FtsL